MVLVAHALTPALRGLVLGGDPEPDASALPAAGDLDLTADETYCSPEQASVRTAAVLGLRATVDADLRDRDYGSWTGRDLEDLLAAEPEAAAAWLAGPDAAPPGGEAAAELVARVGAWLDGLPRSGADRRTVVAVVPPTVVRAAILHVLDAPPAALRSLAVRPLAVVRLTAQPSTSSWSWSLGLAPSTDLRHVRRPPS